MKKYLLQLILIFSIILISCKEEKKEYLKSDKNIPKKQVVKTYNEGDIVYTKPDSVKVTISDVNNQGFDSESYDIIFIIAGESQEIQFVKANNFY